MKEYSKDELSRRLSEYLDGSLNPSEQAEIDEYLAAHPEAAKELRDIRQIKHLLAARKHIDVDPFFWARLSARMDEEAEEEKNLLPFPRKYVPLASAMAILAFVAVGITIFLQRGPILEYVSKQSQAVKEAYESSILKGAVMPLFANIDKDNVLQFALFGTLPLDAKSETALRVDDQSEKGYHIEVGMTADKLPPPVTVKDLYSEVLPTVKQRQQIDRVLEEAKTRIAKGAFYAENNALAVDPELTKLNRVVLSDIAAALAPVQRKRLDRFLVKRNASYSLAAPQIPPVREVAETPQIFHAPKSRHEFVVITEDSTVVTHLALNIDSLVQSEMGMPVVARELPSRLERLMKMRYERMAPSRARTVVSAPAVRTTGEEDFFKVEIQPQFFHDAESMRVWVTPRPKREKMFRFEYRDRGGVKVIGPEDGSAISVEINMGQIDSLVREQMRRGEEFRKADSVFRSKGKLYVPRPPQPDTTDNQ